MPDKINFDLYPPVFPKTGINEEDQRKGELKRTPVEKPTGGSENEKIWKQKPRLKKTKTRPLQPKSEKPVPEPPEKEEDQTEKPKKVIDIRV